WRRFLVSHFWFSETGQQQETFGSPSHRAGFSLQETTLHGNSPPTNGKPERKRLGYAANFSSAKTYNHSTAMKCQYQAVTSTTMRRRSMRLGGAAFSPEARPNMELVAASAQNRAMMPPARCKACAPVK